MKGISLFADVLSVLILLAMIMLMTLLVWSFIILQKIEVTVGSATDWYSPRHVELTLYFLPTKYDTTFLAFLESETQGLPMKKILEACAIQENSTVWIEGKTINAAVISNNFLSSKIDKSYILKIVLPDKEIKIVDNYIASSMSRPTSIQESSTKLFLLNGEVVDLELLVRD